MRAAALCLQADIADPAHSEALVALAADRFGGLDYAFNNAGIGGRPCVIEELSPDDWRKVIDVNLNGVFYGVRHQLPAMLVRGGGVIINTSSVLGIKPS